MTWGGLDLYPLSGAGFRSEIAIFILKKLEPVKMDPSRRTECLEGTRTDILDFVWGFDFWDWDRCTAHYSRPPFSRKFPDLWNSRTKGCTMYRRISCHSALPGFSSHGCHIRALQWSGLDQVFVSDTRFHSNRLLDSWNFVEWPVPRNIPGKKPRDPRNYYSDVIVTLRD